MSVWVKYGPLRQMTDYWAGIRPKQLITLFYGHENLSHVISYFDVMAKTASMGEYPAIVEMSYGVHDASVSEMHVSVNVKDLAAALERIEPERGGFVELTLGSKNFTPSAQFKSPVDSMSVGYEKIRRYDPEHGSIVEYTHANDSLRTNAQKGLLMLRKGDMALHVKPTKWGDMEEYVALGGVLYGKSFKPALSYNEEEMHMTISRRRRNPAAEPDGIVNEPVAGPLTAVAVEIDDLDVTLDPSMMVAIDDDCTAPTDEILEDSYEASIQSISIEDNSDLDAALSGAIVAPNELGVEVDDEEDGEEAMFELEVEEEAMFELEVEEEAMFELEVEDEPDKAVPLTEGTTCAASVAETQSEPMVAAGTLVLMADGRQIPIEKVRNGDRVIDACGNPQSVSAEAAGTPNRWKCKADTRIRVIEDLREHGWQVIEPEAVSAGSSECSVEVPKQSSSARLVAIVGELMHLVDDVRALEETPVVEQIDPVDAAIALLTSMKGCKR